MGMRYYFYILSVINKYNKYWQLKQYVIIVSMKLSAYAKQVGIPYYTAWRYWKKGIIKGTQLSTGTILVEVDNNDLPQNDVLTNAAIVILENVIENTYGTDKATAIITLIKGELSKGDGLKI